MRSTAQQLIGSVLTDATVKARAACKKVAIAVCEVKALQACHDNKCTWTAAPKEELWGPTNTDAVRHHPSIMWARRFEASAQTQLANGNLFFAASGVLGATVLGMYALDARARAASDDVAALPGSPARDLRREGRKAEEAKKPFVFLRFRAWVKRQTSKPGRPVPVRAGQLQSRGL